MNKTVLIARMENHASILIPITLLAWIVFLAHRAKSKKQVERNLQILALRKFPSAYPDQALFERASALQIECAQGKLRATPSLLKKSEFVSDQFGDIHYDATSLPQAVVERFRRILSVALELRRDHGVRIYMRGEEGEPNLSLYQDLEVNSPKYQKPLLGEFVVHVECVKDDVPSRSGYRSIYRWLYTIDWNIDDIVTCDLEDARSISQLKHQYKKFFDAAQGLGVVKVVGRALKKDELPPPYANLPQDQELELNYIDNNGKQTKRKIMGASVWGREAGGHRQYDFLEAMCLQSGKRKTFRRDGVISVAIDGFDMWPAINSDYSK